MKMDKLFPVYEVGSMPKLNQRKRAFSGNPITDEDIGYLTKYAEKTGIDPSNVIEILERQRREGRKLLREERQEIIDFNALLNLRLQENAGLDFVYDGEARRAEMYQNVAKLTVGFKNYQEMVRSRGPDSYRPSICINEPKLKVPLDELPIIKEFEFVKLNATKSIKVPIDDPYMVAVMSGNRHYKDLLRRVHENDPRKLRYEAKRELTLALARDVIRPQVEAVINAGAEWVQLDIPAATIDIEHIPIVVEGINAVVEGIDGVKFSLHICYPKRVTLTDKRGFELLFPSVLDLDERVDHFSLEFANANQYEQDLKPFAEHKNERRFEIGLGVVDITLEQQQKGVIETPEIVRDRVLKAAEILGDPSLIYVAPDCGLRQLSLERSVQLYDVIVRGAEIAREEL